MKVAGVSHDTTQDLGCQQGLHILGREEERRPSIDEHQTRNHGPAISKPLRDPAVDEETDQLANIGALCRVHRSVMLEEKVLNKPLASSEHLRC